MFEEIMRELRKLERGVRIPVSIPLDDEGYFDRHCPDSECGAEFKVLFQDWKDKVKDEAVYCPICRHEADSTNWNTPQQREYIKRVGTSYMHGRVGEALRKDAAQFNRRQPRGGFITMSMTYRPGPRPAILPVSASKTMLQKSACEVCGCRYASIGAAFFCPACGHNSANSTFQDAVDSVTKTVALLPGIRDAIAESGDVDAAEDSVRMFRENGFIKLVSSFQRFAEAKFQSLPNAAQFPVRRNLFQNLADSSDLWKAATGMGYESILSNNEMGEIHRFFQQRHVLAHKDGIVDQDYVDKTGDSRYAVGQRLVLHDGDVLRLAELVSKLARGLGL